MSVEIDLGTTAADEVHVEPVGADSVAGPSEGWLWSSAICITSKVPVPVGVCAGHSVVDLVAAEVSPSAWSLHYSLLPI